MHLSLLVLSLLVGNLVEKWPSARLSLPLHLAMGWIEPCGRLWPVGHCLETPELDDEPLVQLAVF